MKIRPLLLLPVIAAGLTHSATAAAAAPLKALLILGGCCHDYAAQKDILEAGIEARANIQVDVCFADVEKSNTAPTFTCYEKKDWAEGYDVIIHDECAAGIKDPAVVNHILDAHRKGVPAVNLHCAMHSYRTSPNFKQPLADGAEGAMWFDFIGLQSTGHGAQKPIAVTYLESPITKGLENWTTINEELYNNIRIHDSAKAVAKGKQGEQENVVAWTNEYGDKKTRVFSTTLGHNNDTVADARYLDLVTHGLLWACDKLGPDGKPVSGAEPAAK